jgi:chloramphenicol-sensitive protein RarD
VGQVKAPGEKPDGAGQRRIGIVAGAGAYLIWGLFPLYYYRLRGISPLELACLRIVLTSALVWLALGLRRDLAWWRLLVAQRKRLINVAVAGLMITANWLIYVWAAANEHIVDAAIGYFINPLISVALGVFVLHEKLGSAQKIALGFGAAAVIVLTVAYGTVPWVALSLASTFALYGYLKKTTALTGAQALAAETLLMMPLGLAGIAWLAWQPAGLDVASAHSSTVALTVTVGMVTAVPLTMFGVAAVRIPLALLGLLQYITPVGQLLCAVVVLNERVTPARWFGISLVGVALVVLASDLIRELRAPPG